MAASIIALAAATAAAQSKPATYATPEDVIAAAMAASDRNDVAAMLDCYSDAGVEAMTRFLMRFIWSAPASQAASRPFNAERAAFEARHGLDKRQQRDGESRDAYAARLASELTDRRAFLLDFMTIERAARKPSTRPATRPSVENVKVDGDAATAEVVKRDAQGNRQWTTVKLERVDGSWRLASMLMY